MKTATLATLTLVAMANAAPALEARQVVKRNVKLCTETRCLGSPPDQQVNPEVTLDTCFDLVKNSTAQFNTAPFNNKVSAISFNGEIQCYLFDFADCNGGAIGPFQGEILDLATKNFDNLLSSLFCEFKPRTE